jgi:hypothetical protein
LAFGSLTHEGLRSAGFSPIEAIEDNDDEADMGRPWHLVLMTFREQARAALRAIRGSCARRSRKKDFCNGFEFRFGRRVSIIRHQRDLVVTKHKSVSFEFLCR